MHERLTERAGPVNMQTAKRAGILMMKMEVKNKEIELAPST